MFKEKTSKKRLNVPNNAKDNATLDVMHNKMIKTFSGKMEEKEQLIKTLDSLLKIQGIITDRIECLYYNSEHIGINEHYDILWSSNIKLSEEIICINNKIKNIDEYDEIEYYKKTSNILFN